MTETYSLDVLLIKRVNNTQLTQSKIIWIAIWTISLIWMAIQKVHLFTRDIHCSI